MHMPQRRKCGLDKALHPDTPHHTTHYTVVLRVREVETTSSILDTYALHNTHAVHSSPPNAGQKLESIRIELAPGLWNLLYRVQDNVGEYTRHLDICHGPLLNHAGEHDSNVFVLEPRID